MFAYRITIENHNGFSVKLHAVTGISSTATAAIEKWKAKASSAYSPSCSPAKDTSTSAAATSGPKWERCTAPIPMENLNNKKTFEVNIPIFEMIVPFKMSEPLADAHNGHARCTGVLQPSAAVLKPPPGTVRIPFPAKKTTPSI